jgi:thioredoxin-like negative regulator of GroEL
MNESSSNGSLDTRVSEETDRPPESAASAGATKGTQETPHPAAARALQAAQRKRGWRERVGDRLAHRPVLRTIALNPVFSLLVALAIGGAFLFGVSLLKVWRISPPGFRPVVRCSLLDMAQAWSLSRKGREQWRAGDYVAATRSYFAASKNKLTDVTLIRQALRGFVKTEGDFHELYQSANNGSRWLLHLSATNREDVFLVARVYDVMGESGSVLALLEPWQDDLPEDLYGVMAKAEFDFNDVEAFGRWWKRASDAAIEDPTLELYHAAWQAGWGPLEKQKGCLEQLQAAAQRLDQRQLANHLLLKVYRQRQDLLNYRRTLKILESFDGDLIQDHVEYWTLLEELGQKEKALELAEQYPYPPQNAMQVAAWGEVLFELGGASAARRLLERYGSRLGDGPAVLTLSLWALLADLYIAAKDWDPLIQMGRDLRALPRGNATLSGFGWFVEGRGLVELGRRRQAGQAFEQAVQAGLPRETMSLEVANTLLKLDYPVPAQELLTPLEERLADSTRYWELVFRAAYQLRQDEALLFKAARQAFDLEPADPDHQLNYAVALLIERQRPEEAVKLTLDYLAAHPKSPVAQLNHAHALALMGRGDEAQALLRSVPAPGDEESRSTRALVELEVQLSREDFAAAARAANQVKEKFLFPSQRQWLAAVRRQLGLSEVATVQ